jgi:hypothetical protein
MKKLDQLQIELGPLWDRDQRTAFRFESLPVLARLARELGGYRNQQCRKLLIRDEGEPTPALGGVVENILVVSLPIDGADYFARDALGRKSFILDTAIAGARVAADEYGWDWAPFAAAYDAMVRTNFENRSIVTKATSPDRRHVAEVEVNQDTHESEIVLRIRSRKETLAERRVVAVPGIRLNLGKLVWEGNERVVLHSAPFPAYPIRLVDGRLEFFDDQSLRAQPGQPRPQQLLELALPGR